MAFLFKTPKSSRKILFIAPEAKPFAKAGGLGEVMFSLPRAMAKLGHDARVMIPRYADIDPDKYHLRMEYSGLEVPTDSVSGKDNEPAFLTCNVRKFDPSMQSGSSIDSDEKNPVITYFLENQEYYEKRSNVYGYSDDAVRWALFCRGVLEFLRVSKDWMPDVIVSSDWQTGFLSSYLNTSYKQLPKFANLTTVFMIHNLYYQGMFDHRYVNEMDFDDGQSAMPSLFDPRLLNINGMRRGIMYSDLVTTVSPTYSQEIMTKEFGEMLDELLKERRARVHGVLNGIDYEEFNPETDKNLPVNYRANSLTKRAKNKEELQAKFGLPKDKKVPVVAIVSRLVEQKGFDLLFGMTEPLLKELGFQLVIVGGGDGKYMGYFKELAEKFPQQVSAHLSFDPILPRLIFGGADMILIPSRFEPCGLVQMEAMRYGVVPVVRKTGGLNDSVTDFNTKTGIGNGFVFSDYNALSMGIALTRAMEHYRNPITWREIQKQAMARNFSWEKSAEEYTKLYDLAINFKTKHRGKGK
jgi:starch synthase